MASRQIKIRNAADRDRLPAQSRDAWERVNDAVAEARRENLRPATAAHRLGTTMASWRKYAPETLRMGPLGHLVVTETDRRYTGEMHITSTEGDVVRAIRGSVLRSTVAEHANAVRIYLATGDTTGLERFKGARVAGVELETDPDALDEMGRSGELDWLSLYEGRAA